LAGYLSGRRAADCWRSAPRADGAPKMNPDDEPSMGLSPLLVKEVFAIIRDINRDLGVTILLGSRNAPRRALGREPTATHGTGPRWVLDGSADEIARQRGC